MAAWYGGGLGEVGVADGGNGAVTDPARVAIG